MSIFRIGMVGTFDISNFGDLLFPLIARHELEQRLGPVEIRPYSYHARSETAWPFAVTPLSRLAGELSSLDLLLVGGGDIIRFDSLVALDYRPDSPDIHHPTGFWLAPILMAHAANVPVAWNAPGVPHAVPSWAHTLVRAAIAVSSYVNVRDHASAGRLARAAGEIAVEVVPDSGFNAAELLAGQPAVSDSLVVQSRPEAARWLVRVRELLHDDRSPAVVVPVGPVTGDLVRPPAGLPPRSAFHHPRHPIDMLECIARSKGVIGPSLHLTIAALSLGRPAFRPRSSPLTKYQMLDGLQGIHDFGLDAAGEPIGLSTLAPDPAQLAEVRRKLRLHWDAIAALPTRSAAPSRSSRTWEPLIMSLWQQMPARLERKSTAARLRTTLQTAVTRLRRARYGGIAD